MVQLVRSNCSYSKGTSPNCMTFLITWYLLSSWSRYVGPSQTFFIPIMQQSLKGGDQQWSPTRQNWCARTHPETHGALDWYVAVLYWLRRADLLSPAHLLTLREKGEVGETVLLSKMEKCVYVCERLCVLPLFGLSMSPPSTSHIPNCIVKKTFGQFYTSLLFYTHHGCAMSSV